MTDPIIDPIVKEHAGPMLKYANFTVGVVKGLKFRMTLLDLQSRKIAGSRYMTNHKVEVIKKEYLEAIEGMGMSIKRYAECKLRGVPKTEPQTDTDTDDDAPYQGRVKMTRVTVHSKEKIKEQALQLRGIRRTYARTSVAMIRKLGVIVKRMKQLDSKMKRAIEMSLHAAGKTLDSLDDVVFEKGTPKFAWVLKKVNPALREMQTIADSDTKDPPPLPSEEVDPALREMQTIVDSDTKDPPSLPSK